MALAAQLASGSGKTAFTRGGVSAATPCGRFTAVNNGGVNGQPFAAGSGCGQIQLTTAWSASLAFEHLWTPALRTSWYGSYIAVSHNDAGKFLICNSGSVGFRRLGVPDRCPECNGLRSGLELLGTSVPRTQWEPLKGLGDGLGRDLQQAQTRALISNAGQFVNLARPTLVREGRLVSTWFADQERDHHHVRHPARLPALIG